MVFQKKVAAATTVGVIFGMIAFIMQLMLLSLSTYIGISMVGSIWIIFCAGASTILAMYIGFDFYKHLGERNQ